MNYHRGQWFVSDAEITYMECKQLNDDNNQLRFTRLDVHDL